MNVERAKDMYLNDPVFHSLVKSLESAMEQMQYTPGELRAAAMLAAIHFEERNTRAHLFGYRADLQGVKHEP